MAFGFRFLNNGLDRLVQSTPKPGLNPEDYALEDPGFDYTPGPAYNQYMEHMQTAPNPGDFRASTLQRIAAALAAAGAYGKTKDPIRAGQYGKSLLDQPYQEAARQHGEKSKYLKFAADAEDKSRDTERQYKRDQLTHRKYAVDTKFKVDKAIQDLDREERELEAKTTSEKDKATERRRIADERLRLEKIRTHASAAASAASARRSDAGVAESQVRIDKIKNPDKYQPTERLDSPYPYTPERRRAIEDEAAEKLAEKPEYAAYGITETDKDGESITNLRKLPPEIRAKFDAEHAALVAQLATIKRSDYRAPVKK